MGVYNSLLLKKQFAISTSIIEVENKLALYSQEEFEIKKIGQHEYKFISNLSFGTLVSKYGSRAEGIRVYTLLAAEKESLVNVTIKTKVRVELILMAFITLVFGLSTAFSNQSLPIWSIILLPFVLIGFWLIYRFQEQNLISKVETYLLSFQ